MKTPKPPGDRPTAPTKEGQFSESPPRPLPKSTQKLVDALVAAKAPAGLIERARNNEFHDFLTSRATPMMDLVEIARGAGLHDIANAAVQGAFDAGPDDGWKTPKRSGRTDLKELREAELKNTFGEKWGGVGVGAEGFVATAKEFRMRNGEAITKEEAIALVKQWREAWPEISELFRDVLKKRTASELGRCMYCGKPLVFGGPPRAEYWCPDCRVGHFPPDCPGIDQSTVEDGEVTGEPCALPRKHVGPCRARSSIDAKQSDRPDLKELREAELKNTFRGEAVKRIEMGEFVWVRLRVSRVLGSRVEFDVNDDPDKETLVVDIDDVLPEIDVVKKAKTPRSPPYATQTANTSSRENEKSWWCPKCKAPPASISKPKPQPRCGCGTRLVGGGTGWDSIAPIATEEERDAAIVAWNFNREAGQKISAIKEILAEEHDDASHTVMRIAAEVKS